jgi:hypothetical protein
MATDFDMFHYDSNDTGSTGRVRTDGKELSMSGSTEQCPHHSGIHIAISEHERRINDHDQIVKRIYDKIESVEQNLGAKIEQITNHLLQRPGWFTTTIISLLTTALGITITLLMKKP